MKKTSISYPIYIILLLSIMTLSCEDGENGLNSIISTEVESSGANCEAGGIKINYGLDANRNNILEETEIESLCVGHNLATFLNNKNEIKNSFITVIFSINNICSNSF